MESSDDWDAGLDVVEAARGACVKASQAVGIALDAPAGTPDRAGLVDWASQSAIEALRLLADDRLWTVVGAAGGRRLRSQRVDLSGRDRGEIQPVLLDLLGGSLAQVLVESGHRPPPDHWVLVARVRAAADRAIAIGRAVDYEYVMRQLNQLLSAFEVLRMLPDQSHAEQQHTLSWGKRALAGGGMFCVVLGGVLTGQVNSTIDDLRENVIYPVAAQAWTELMEVTGLDNETPPADPHAKDSNGAELRRTQLEAEQARLRAAEAEEETALLNRETAVLRREKATEELKEVRDRRGRLGPRPDQH